MSEEFGPVRWLDWDRVQFERGMNLPHFEQVGAIYFVTFRLWDSLPAEVYQKVCAAREGWLGNNNAEGLLAMEEPVGQGDQSNACSAGSSVAVGRI